MSSMQRKREVSNKKIRGGFTPLMHIRKGQPPPPRGREGREGGGGRGREEGREREDCEELEAKEVG